MASLSTRPLLARARDPFSGYSHLVGLGLAIAGAGVLGVVARGAQLAAALVYAATLIALYAASSAYHLVNLGHDVTARLRRYDHAAIFLLIAGTSTPLFATALEGRARVLMLTAVWAMAIAGILFRALWVGAPRWLYTASYVATGWVVVLKWRAVVAGLPSSAFACLVAGGVVYSLGALVYALKWPDPRPGRFGFHDVWHVFVLAASVLHFAAIAIVTAG